MISYASIEEIERDFVVCELELISVKESNPSEYKNKKTDYVLIPIEMFETALSDYSEGDIVIVEHENGDVQAVCCKDNAEKQKRIEIIKQILKK